MSATIPALVGAAGQPAADDGAPVGTIVLLVLLTLAVIVAIYVGTAWRGVAKRRKTGG